MLRKRDNMKSLNPIWEDRQFEKMKAKKDEAELSWEAFIYEAIMSYNGRRQNNSQRSS